MLILVAAMLPALHAFEHFSDSEKTQIATENVLTSNLDCDLCDFNLSPSHTSGISDYQLYSPDIQDKYSYSEQNAIPVLLSYFSLRAPPAATI